MKPVARIIVACAAEESRTKVSRLLASSGFSAFRCCGNGSELRRVINESRDGIVILVGSLPDCKPDELQADFGDVIQILLIGKPQVLEDCESPEVFRLPLPASGQAMIGAVEMLSQLHGMRLPKRSGSEKQTVEEAKALLMRRDGLSEAEAHRALQQYAMRHGVRMADYAARLIRTSERTEE